MQKYGYFISFEGIDGSGKSTQIKLLYQHLIDKEFDVVLTKEPGGTFISEKIRSIILNVDTESENEKMFPETEALLFAAARAQHVRQIIKPALEKGKIVLTDRYIDSSLAYQGELRGLGLDNVMEINRLAIDNMLPNLTICLTLPIEVVKKKLSMKELDRIEQSFNEKYWQKILFAYDCLAKNFPERFIIIDANKNIEDISSEIIKIFEKHYQKITLK